MKITIIGGGNMGGAIVKGLATGKYFRPENITVINRTPEKADKFKLFDSRLNAVTSDYSSLKDADVIILGVKPWMIEDVIKEHHEQLTKKNKLIVSVAALITLEELSAWTSPSTAVFRVVPNTAIAVKQSMTYISSANANREQEKIIFDIFSELGKAEIIAEKTIPAVTSVTSCGIAFAFRYIRAAMEGGVELGMYPDQAKEAVMQTLRGAIDLLETNGSHPEAEIDKVTTAGGITIKGLNEMEHNGFTSSVIKGLKASH